MTIKTRVTHEEIDKLYNELLEAFARWSDKKKEYEDEKASLEAHYIHSLNNGDVVGSNEAKRRGDHSQKYPEFYMHLEKLTDELAEDKLAVDLLRIKEDRLKALLRVDEMMVRAWSAAQ